MYFAAIPHNMVAKTTPSNNQWYEATKTWRNTKINVWWYCTNLTYIVDVYNSLASYFQLWRWGRWAASENNVAITYVTAKIIANLTLMKKIIEMGMRNMCVIDHWCMYHYEFDTPTSTRYKNVAIMAHIAMNMHAG